jgi:hypothetical protein
VLAIGLSAKTYASPLPVVLNIDISNPSAVTITGLPVPLESDTFDGFDEILGVDLLGFFTSDVGSLSGSASGNLIPSGTSTIAYDSYRSDNYSGDYLDLNLFTAGDDRDLQTFINNQPPFTGTLTLDLSSLSAYFPTAGTQGIIESANSFKSGDNSAIGLWSVTAESTPEPSTCALMGVAAGALLLFKKRR